MFIGLGLALTSYGSGASSGAMALLAGETQGLALDFTDDHFQASQGFYGSAAIKDTGTPANAYNGSPVKAASSLLAYTSPSPKLTMGPDGLYRYQAHNLYLNSAAPANQSITVVSGATYAITITGTVSVTASGAATGTWTAGTNTFTAATGTLTLGSTSGTGTVHVRGTPSDPTYLATTSSARYDLPYEWNTSGDLQGILVEEARTNICLYGSDLTQAAWTPTNVTRAKTATGPTGVANSATTLTATAGNATILQAITSASAGRITSCYIKRRTGSGAIEMTQNNGSTWTAVTVTSGWTRVNIASATLADPTVGLRIVTNGDAVDVALFQHEVGAFITSPIETFASSVTRSTDNISLATSAFPFTTAQGTWYVQFRMRNVTSNARFIGTNSAVAPLKQEGTNTTTVDSYTGNHSLLATTGGPSWPSGAKAASSYEAGARSCVMGGGVVVGDTESFGAYTTIYIGYRPASSQIASGHFQQIMYLPRRMSDAELEEITAP